jgi:hypothetical protein
MSCFKSDYRIIIFVHPVEPVPGCNCYVRSSLSTQHRAVATCVFVCAVFLILPASRFVRGVANDLGIQEFEYWIGQNVSPPLRLVLAIAGFKALSLCYTGKAGSRSHIEEIRRLLWNLNIPYRIHITLTCLQKKPIQAAPQYFFKIRCNILPS